MYAGLFWMSLRRLVFSGLARSRLFCAGLGLDLLRGAEIDFELEGLIYEGTFYLLLDTYLSCICHVSSVYRLSKLYVSSS